MTEERFKEIFEAEKNKSLNWTGDNIWQGLQILAKYMVDKTLICGADHDIIYSVDICDIVAAGITEEDVVKLAQLNWMIHGDYCLACFV